MRWHGVDRCLRSMLYTHRSLWADLKLGLSPGADCMDTVKSQGRQFSQLLLIFICRQGPAVP